MKILYGYPYFPSKQYDNVEKLCLEIIMQLRESGFDVDPFCLSLDPPSNAFSFERLDRLWTLGDRKLLAFYERLYHACENYDVFFNSPGINLHPDFVKILPCLTVFGCNDDPDASEHLSKPVATAYDICLIGNIAELDTYKSWGVKKVGWLPLGLMHEFYDKTLTKEKIFTEEREVDLFFLGDKLSPVRTARLEQLGKAFPDAAFFGRGWQRGYLPVGQEIEWLRRTKIGLNIHNTTGPVNLRSFYLPANGVLQICDNKSHLGKVFELGKEVVGFDSIGECIDLCRYYLEHDEERRAIAAAGWERAIRDYPYPKVFQKYFVEPVQMVLSANTAKKNSIPVEFLLKKRVKLWKKDNNIRMLRALIGEIAFRAKGWLKKVRSKLLQLTNLDRV